MASLLNALVSLVAIAITLASTNAFSATVSRREAIVSSAAAVAPFVALSNANAAPLSDLSNFIDGPRGLKYQVVTPPRDVNSAKTERAQRVSAYYTLWTGGFGEDGGKQVDSSKNLLGDKAFEFNAGVSQVIKGWDLAVLDMRAGEKRRLVVPSDLGYGDKGAGGKIPGGETLYFDMELIKIGDKKELKPDQVKWLEDNPV